MGRSLITSPANAPEMTTNPITLPSVSKDNVNIIGYYESKLFGIRLVYNWRGKYDLAAGNSFVGDARTVLADYPVALIVPSPGAAKFLDGNAITARRGLKLAVYDDPVLLTLSRSLFANAELVVVPDYSSLPGVMSRVDGAVWTLEQGTAWAAEHTGFTAVAPDGLGGPIPSAYAMAPDAAELSAYLNQWLQLRKEDGFRAEQIAYWMHLGRRRIQEPRWNLLDVFLKRH